jgi:hypothetical protein
MSLAVNVGAFYSQRQCPLTTESERVKVHNITTTRSVKLRVNQRLAVRRADDLLALVTLLLYQSLVTLALKIHHCFPSVTEQIGFD